MRRINIIKKDIQCKECKREVTRLDAEVQDWIELILCDAGGTKLEVQGYICNKCQESQGIMNWLDHNTLEKYLERVR